MQLPDHAQLLGKAFDPSRVYVWATQNMASVRLAAGYRHEYDWDSGTPSGRMVLLSAAPGTPKALPGTPAGDLPPGTAGSLNIKKPLPPLAPLAAVTPTAPIPKAKPTRSPK